MPPSLIAAYQAFYQPGVTQIYVAASLANYLAPTRPELDAALNVTRQVKAVDNWEYSADTIERPDYATTFTGIIGGRTKVSGAPTLGIYAAKSGADARATLLFGWNGFVIFLDGGDVSGYKMDVWPVQVIARPKKRSDSEPLTMMYTFAVPQPPAEDVAIP